MMIISSESSRGTNQIRCAQSVEENTTRAPGSNDQQRPTTFTMEDIMIRRAAMLVTIGLTAFSSGSAFCADEHEQQALIKSIGDAKINLQQGLTAAEAQGQPISGKFEVEDGKLQLSVYTAKDGKFFEVVVDFVGGKITKTEPITEGDDLTAAKAQSAAMMKAK